MDVSQFLLPDSDLRLRDLKVTPELMAILAESCASIAQCPGCQLRSDRVHGRYLRSVADLSCQGRRVLLRLVVRRFRCTNAACPKRTFTERLSCVGPSAQATTRLLAAQTAIGFALGGEAGARLAGHLGTPASPDTLLRRVRQAEHIQTPTPRVLGGDDFAFRKGQSYGTILVDLQSHQVVDLLPDREASTVAEWLRGHPGIEVVSRDRASAYSQAAREAAPGAMQVADRWHLLCTMRDALERFFHQRSATIRERFAKTDSRDSPEPDTTTTSPIEPSLSARDRRHESRQTRFDEVRRLHAEGHSLRGIARSLGLHYQTVERYVRSETCPDWCGGHRRPSCLDQFADFIERRLGEGCQNVRQLIRELRGIGYRGGRTILRAYVRRLELESGERAQRANHPPLAARVDVPSARRLAVSVVRRPDDRSVEERRSLKTLGQDGGEVGEAIDLAGSFAAMIRGRNSEALAKWLFRAEASPVAGLRSFARRLRQDEAAVHAGVTVEWSNGPVEGHVNRLKSIKRSMFGRASFDLLKARVLHAG